MWRLLAIALFAIATSHSAAAGQPPQRIISLNLCIDPIVLELVPRERIQALSQVSADRNVSAIVDRIGGIRLVKGAAEEVLALDPDLVLAGDYTTPATVDLLRRLGRRVEVIPMALDVDGVRTTIQAVARAVGELDRGARLISHFNRALEAAQVKEAGRRPEAVVYQANSLVSQNGSLAAAALKAAGFANAAGRLQPGPGGRVSLEALVVRPPALVALGQSATTYRTPLADNLRHPALAYVLSKRPHVDLPMPLWLCGTQHLADAVMILARAREQLIDRSRP